MFLVLVIWGFDCGTVWGILLLGCYLTMFVALWLISIFHPDDEEKFKATGIRESAPWPLWKKITVIILLACVVLPGMTAE